MKTQGVDFNRYRQFELQNLIEGSSRGTMHDPLTAIASGDTYTTVGPAHDEEGLH